MWYIVCSGFFGIGIRCSNYRFNGFGYWLSFWKSDGYYFFMFLMMRVDCI